MDGAATPESEDRGSTGGWRHGARGQGEGSSRVGDHEGSGATNGDGGDAEGLRGQRVGDREGLGIGSPGLLGIGQGDRVGWVTS